MKIPFTKSISGEQRPVSLIAALVLVALVPAVGVLWFMSVAMRNERLAVQERLTAVYTTHLATLQQRVTAFGRERQAALQAHAGGAPAQTFAAIVRAQLADGVIVTDAAGKVLYPSSSAAADAGMRVEEGSDWARARELEFQKHDFAGAAEIYGRIAESSREPNARARAMLGQAACWLRAGAEERALARLTELTDEASLRHAVSAQGALIGPYAQLLMLKTLGGKVGPALRAGLSSDPIRDSNPGRLGEPAPPSLWFQTLANLVARLNDYTAADLPANQRRFLMTEVQALSPLPPPGTPNFFPTLAAENLAADYLEHNPAPPADAKPERTLRLVAASASERTAGHSPVRQAQGPESADNSLVLATAGIAKVWRLPGDDRTVIALWREDRLRAELAKQLDALALPDVRVSVLAPGDAAPTIKMPVPPQDAGEFFPGWRLALGFRDGDPLAEAAARQARFYLWLGVGVVAIIAVLAWLVARYVGAQMRLARMKDELVSTVSHELKTPLASMRVLLDTLSAGRCRDEAHMQRYLHLATKENLRLSHLIGNFLVFSRLERGQQNFHFTTLSPQEVVRTALDALGEKLTAPACRLTTQVAPDLPSIRGDPDALATVLVNLLDNACKYTNGEKRIAVNVYAGNGTAAHTAETIRTAEFVGRNQAQEGAKKSPPFLAHFCASLRPSDPSRAPASRESVVFEVADNGIGIAPDEQKRIFERFYQVDQTLTRQRGGCGLGLSIVRSIVRAHGGVVEVSSVPGQGSTFRVRIPGATLNA